MLPDGISRGLIRLGNLNIAGKELRLKQDAKVFRNVFYKFYCRYHIKLDKKTNNPFSVDNYLFNKITCQKQKPKFTKLISLEKIRIPEKEHQRIRPKNCSIDKKKEENLINNIRIIELNSKEIYLSESKVNIEQKKSKKNHFIKS